MLWISRFALYGWLLASLTLNAAHASDSLPILKGIGGDFSAPSTLGRDISLSGLGDKPKLVFFGYTNCADICPTTLGHLSVLTAPDGQLQDRVAVLFVTVDPEFDTTEHLSAYLDHFDSSYIGITGSRAAIDEIVELFQARYQRLAEQPVTTQFKKFKARIQTLIGGEESRAQAQAYLYSHSATIYLLDQKNRVRATYFNGTPIAKMRADIESLIAESK